MKASGVIVPCLCAAFLGGAILLTSCTSPDPNATPSPSELAWTACTSFIEKRYGLPPQDGGKYTPNGVKVSGNLYQVDVYYASRDRTFQCLMARDESAQTWALKNLDHIP